MSKIRENLPDFDKLWNYGNPKETKDKFLEILPDAENSGDMNYYLELLTQIARTSGLQQQFEEAHRYLDQVISLLNEETQVAKIRYLLERGRAFNSSNQKEKSLHLFLEAFNLAQSLGEDYYSIDAAHMLGIVEIPEKQIEWNLKAMKIAENSDNERAKGWLGSLYNNLGWTYFGLKDFDRTLELFQKGYHHHKEKKNKEKELIAKWTIARTYREIKQTEKALEMQLEIRQEREEANLEIGGYNYEELGELYLIMGQKEKSKKSFAIAYELLSKDIWLTKNESERLERIKNLSLEN